MASDPLTDQVDRLLSKIVTLKSNPHYRIADVVYRRGFRFQDSADNVLALPEFDGTILKAYLQQVPNLEKRDIPLLSALIDQTITTHGFPHPAADEMVIHIRAGDVIEHDWFLKRDYSKDLENRPDIRTCTLAICFAFQEFAERNWWMFSEEKLQGNIAKTTALLRKLISAFPAIRFDIYSHRDVDRDFAYMVTARHFIRDQGGFSDLICELRRYRATNASR